MAATLPPIDRLPSLPAPDRAAVLDLLFEPCTALHDLANPHLASLTFSSYDDLIDHVGVLLSRLASASPSSVEISHLESILGAHPRLGAKKVESAQSQAEQAQLNRGGGGVEEAQKLQELNEEYEKAYPGLRYVVFVNGRSRPVIMENMKTRIARGDIAAERADAIKVRDGHVVMRTHQ